MTVKEFALAIEEVITAKEALKEKMSVFNYNPYLNEVIPMLGTHREKLLLEFAQLKILDINVHMTESIVAPYEVNVPYKNINFCAYLNEAEYQMFQEQGLLDARINRTRWTI